MAHLFNSPVTRTPVAPSDGEVSQELSQRPGNYLVSRNEKVMRWAVLRVLRSPGRPGLLRTRLRDPPQAQLDSNLLLTLAMLATLSSEDTSYLPCAHIFLSTVNNKFILGQRDTLSLLSLVNSTNLNDQRTFLQEKWAHHGPPRHWWTLLAAPAFSPAPLPPRLRNSEGGKSCSSGG